MRTEQRCGERTKIKCTVTVILCGVARLGGTNKISARHPPSTLWPEAMKRLLRLAGLLYHPNVQLEIEAIVAGRRNCSATKNAKPTDARSNVLLVLDRWRVMPQVTISETNYRWKNITIALGISALGLGGIAVAPELSSETLKHLISTVGESLLVGGLLAFAFEFALRRDILRMIFEMKEDIDANKRWGEVSKSLGLASILKSDHEIADELIRDSINLALVMNDGRTWLSTHENEVEQRLSKSDRETTVYLVHPQSPHLISLSRKVDATEQELRHKIGETIKLLRRHQKNGHRLRVYGHFLPASYSLIHTESFSCQTPYPIGRKVEQVPVFVFANIGEGAAVYSSIAKDIETIHTHALELFPNEQMHIPRHEYEG